LNGRTFDRCGQTLWRTHVATGIGSILATLAIAAMHARQGASAYFDPLELFAFSIGADVYLALASGIAWVTHYPDHPTTSRQFLIVAVLSALLAILNGVLWIELPRLI
jgi:hypothetical protein